MKEIGNDEEETLVSSPQRASYHLQKSKGMGFVRAYLLPGLFLVMLMAYAAFWLLTYFMPMLFNAQMPKAMMQFSAWVFPSGRESFEEGYTAFRRRGRLLFEFGFFVVCFINLFISFLMTYFTSPGHIPKDSFWQLQIPHAMNAQMQLEAFALSVVEREELLEANRNCIQIPLQSSIASLSSAPSSSKGNSIHTSPSSFYHISDRSEANEVRYCKTCLSFKPDRSHHCKVCNRCVLKMDHHCPYIGCCIGFRNYKYFNLMLLYSWLLSLHFLITYAVIIKKAVVNSMRAVFFLNEIAFAAWYAFTVYVFVFAFVLWLFHIYLDVNNMTTFEYVDMNKKRLKSKQVSLFTVSFDFKSRYCAKSVYENLGQVYGDWVSLWIVPVPPIHSDKMWNNGVNFKVNERFSYEIIKAI